MRKRSTTCKAMSLLVFAFLYGVCSCKNPEPDKGREKDTKINLHLVIKDSFGKPQIDTIYSIQLASLDTFRVEQMALCSGPPTKTGGSSPCTVDVEVFKDKDPNDDDDDKN